MTRCPHDQWIFNMPTPIFQCTIIQSSPLLGLNVINGLLTFKHSYPPKRPLMVHCRHQNWKEPFHLRVKDQSCKLCIFFAPEIFTLGEGLECLVSLTHFIVRLSDLTRLHAQIVSKFALCRRAGPVKTVLGSLHYLTH